MVLYCNSLMKWLLLASLLLLAGCDSLDVTVATNEASATTIYTFILFFDNPIVPDVTTDLLITFPADYAGRLATGNYPCSISYWATTPTPTVTCSLVGLALRVVGATAGATDLSNNLLAIDVSGLLNPYLATTTGVFQFTCTVDGSSYVLVSGSGIALTSANMPCTTTTTPSATNQNGVINFSFKPPYFPSSAVLQIVFSTFWPQTQPQLAQNQVMQSSTLACQGVTSNVAGTISCSYSQISSSYVVDVTSIATGNLSSAWVSFSLGPILTPPTVQSQGDFAVVASLNGVAMAQCSSVTITGTTAGSLSNAQFLPISNYVNVVGEAVLQFRTNSNIVATDTVEVNFPSAISLTALSSFATTSGNAQGAPSVNNQKVTFSGLIAFQNDVISVTFTNVRNPTSELATTGWSITTYRSGNAIETTTSLAYAPLRTTLGAATLSSTSLEIGVNADYSIGFVLGQPLALPQVIVSLPTILQGRIGSCSPLPCQMGATQILFNISATTVGSSVALQLLSVTNPLTLGATTSLTVTTVYNYSQPASYVESVSSGLTLTLIARVLPAQNVIIAASSLVVGYYPTTYTLTISNINALPAYAYLVLYIPPEITVLSPAQLICQAGSSSLACTFDTSTRKLTMGYFSGSVLAAGQLSSMPVSVLNLVNPSSTRPTTSFGITLLNSLHQTVEYLTAGLSFQVTSPSPFFSLTLRPNNTQNSALSLLVVNFNIAATSYVNSSLLALTFPSTVNLQLSTCLKLSANLGSVVCTLSGSRLQMQLNFADLSPSTATEVQIAGYRNFPSLEPFTVTVDLFEDTFQQSKLCTGSVQLQNTQVGALSLSSYAFSNPTLKTLANLNIVLANASSSTFTSLILTFPQEFSLGSAACSLPSGATCSINGTAVTITASGGLPLPVTFSITNLLTPSFTPSSPVYLQTFSSSSYLMDATTDILFQTACTLPCKTCSGSQCSSCYNDSSLVSGQVLLNGTVCSSACSLGYYQDNSTLACIACDVSCATCSSLTVCLSCNGSFLYNSSCLGNCPFGYYGFSGVCLGCPSAIFCESCSSSYQCLTCLAGYFLLAQQCATSCPSPNYLPNYTNRTCDDCPLNCTACTGNTSLSVCTGCSAGYVLDAARCYSNCVTAGLMAVNGSCVGCSAICGSCSGVTTNCTSCVSNSSSPYLYNNTCLGQCPNGYFASNASFTCLACTSPCEFCLSSSVHSCLSCVATYYLHQSDCLQTCPTGYYGSGGACVGCVAPCSSCSSELVCLSCSSGSYLYLSQCPSACPAGMAIVNGNECLVCPSTCLSCVSPSVCTACYSAYYLSSGSCIATCPNSTYPNINNHTCDSCQPPCSNCVNSTYCLSCADSARFLQDGQCLTCASPCATCSLSPTNCTSCLSSSSQPYYYGGACIASCPATHFSDNTTYQCVSCAYPCLGCSGATNSSCLACIQGFYFLSGSCYLSCPTYFFASVTVCSACQSPCAACSSASTCLSCVNGSYLWGSTCQGSCGTGTAVVNGSICAICASTCLTCQSANTSACTSCYTTTYLLASTCNPTCPSTYFADSASLQCISCFAPCATCTSSTNCLTCNDPSLFLVSGSCLGCLSPCSTCSGLRSNCTSCNSTFPYLHGGTCLSVCPVGSYAEVTGVCLSCSSPCSSCSNSSSASCLTCVNGYYQLEAACLLVCPGGYFPNVTVCSQCQSPCQTCLDATTCLSCNSSNFLLGSNCVAACPTGMAIINSTICQSCSSSCVSCQSSNSSACTSCPNTTFLLAQQCLSTCTTLYYPDAATGHCLSCVAPCLACSSSTYCLSCLDSSLFLVNGSCLGCLSPCSGCALSRSNCTSCSVLTGFQYLLNSTCVDICPSTYYPESGLGICLRCTSPCETCTSAAVTSCASCVTSYLLLGSTCVVGCPGGYYPDTLSCLVCDFPCLNCVAAGVCTSCRSGLLLEGSSCVSNCSSGSAAINSTYCQVCGSPCVTCMSANTTYCTSCGTGLLLMAGTCYVSCPSLYFADSVSSQCLSCIAPCLTCSTASYCLSCIDTSMFLVNGSCLGCLSPCLTCSSLRSNCTSCDGSSLLPYLVGGTCVGSCPAGSYSNGLSCLTCPSPCSSCNNGSSSSCVSCLSGYVLLNSSCLLGCPSGYYSNGINCVTCVGCATCSSSSICLSCAAGSYLLGSVCNSSCPSGMITNNGATGGVCQYCSASCLTCQLSNTTYCTSCSSSYLYLGECLPTCPSLYYANNVSYQCAACVSPCSTCTSPTVCLSCLASAPFLVGSTCVGCSSSCATCSGTPSNCTSCDTSSLLPYLHLSACLLTCPATYYNAAGFSCLACSSPCLTCSGAGSASCSTCLQGYLQLGTSCYLACPTGYYTYGFQCLACVAPCFGCLAPGSCTSCENGLYLMGSSCVSNCSGMAIVGGSCAYCVSTCLTCLTSNSSYCSSCSSPLLLYSGTCVSACSSGFFADGGSGQCLPCIAPCLTCSSSTACLSCASSALFLVGSSCLSCSSPCLACSGSPSSCTACNSSSSAPYLLSGQCLSSCPVGSYNLSSTSCSLCSSPCDSCSGGGTHACLTCLSGYYLLLPDCYATCPSGYFSNGTICSPCTSPCFSCLGSPTVCLSCSPSYYLRGSSCVASCPVGEVVSGSLCLSCSSSCLTCLSANSSYCTSCNVGQYLSGGLCLSTCPSLTFADSSSGRCTNCASPCLTCASLSVCLSCVVPTQFLVGSNCVSCDASCLTCAVSPSNCTACNSSSTLTFLLGSTCLANCPSGYYDSGMRSCLLCASPCATCSGSGNRSCLSCLSGYMQLGSDCYSTCPATYYSNSTSCVACNPTCLNCVTSATTCLSCASGLLLSGSSCGASCASGQIATNGICAYCNSPCQTCLSANASFCTSCYSVDLVYQGGCVSVCPYGYFAESGVCQACVSPCTGCTSLTVCLGCNSVLLYLQSGTCRSSCSYPLLALNNTCYQCSSQCLTCSGNLTTCLLCSTGFYYFPASLTCSLLCSFRVLPAALSTSGNKQCVSACPSGTYPDTASTNCLACPSACTLCSSASSCSSCVGGYYFYGNWCYSVCPAVAPFALGTVCILCNVTGCTTCANNTHCSVCNASLLLVSTSDSSSCLSACPSGSTYNSSTLTCVSTSSISSTTLAGSSVTSALPHYSLLAAGGSLVFLSFVVRFRQPSTDFPITMVLSLSLAATAAIIHLIYQQLTHIGLLSLASCLLLASGGTQLLGGLSAIIAVAKIRDASLMNQWSTYPFALGCIGLIGLADPAILLITTSQLFNLPCFQLKYGQFPMSALMKFIIVMAMLGKLLSIGYSILQMMFSTTARLLLTTTGLSLDSSFSTQLLILSGSSALFSVYCLLRDNSTQSSHSGKSESHHSLIDEGQVFDKRNESDSQIVLSLDNSDMVVDLNSIQDEKDFTNSRTQSRRMRRSKVTPAEMLQQMQLPKEEQVEQEADVAEIDNVFFKEEEDKKGEEIDGTTPRLPGEELPSIDVSAIIYPLDATDKEEQERQQQLQAEKEEQAKREAKRVAAEKEQEQQRLAADIEEKTKTQIIQIVTIDTHHPDAQAEKYSPSEVSEYHPNQDIEREFAQSHMDDANKYNDHADKLHQAAIEKEKLSQLIKFEEVNVNYDEKEREEEQQDDIDEITFHPQEPFLMPPQQKQQEKRQIEEEEEEAEDEDARRKKQQDEDIEMIIKNVSGFAQPIEQIDEQQSYRQETGRTPARNTFFQPDDEPDYDASDYKPSDGLKGSKRKYSHKKPDIPLPKNEKEKEIMSIYQKKEAPSSKKKRYPDIPNPNKSKNSHYVEYSLEDRDFREDRPSVLKNDFSIDLSRKQPRYNSRNSRDSSGEKDEDMPGKPSQQLRKSSFKKIGEMVIQGQSSGRK